jgi:hypothetical protein
LRDSGKLAKLSIAERMKWASGRKTTRIEDIAYCLLGIFDINMPLLYGEGNKAFTRLQQEIIKVNNDLSIFGWSPEESAISIDEDAEESKDVKSTVAMETAIKMVSTAS